MIKRYDNFGYEIGKDFIVYFDKFKRDKVLKQKILKLKKKQI